MKKTFSIIFTLFFSTFVLLSSPSNNKIVQAAESKLLAIPTGFTLDIYNDKDVIVLWDEPTDERITDFAILRSDEADKAPTEIARVAASQQTFIDENVELGKTYTYRIRSLGAAGTTPTETDAKSILVKKTEETLVTTPDPAEGMNKLANDTIGKLAGAQEPDQFIPNLLAVNLLVIGVMLIAYLSLRAIIKKRSVGKTPTAKVSEETKSVEQPSTEPTGTAPENAELESIELKTGHQDKNIIRTAQKRFLKRENKKLQDWEK